MNESQPHAFIATSDSCHSERSRGISRYYPEANSETLDMTDHRENEILG